MSVEMPPAKDGSARRLVLDLVAIKERVTLCAEAKATADREDEAKLRRLFAAEEAVSRLRHQIRTRCAAAVEQRHRSKLLLLPTLAYCRGRLAPEDFVVLVAAGRGRVSCHVGPRVRQRRRALAALGS
ncbi:MAG: hypothetical protein ACE5R4_08840 [Armatimonadota bacterium]